MKAVDHLSAALYELGITSQRYPETRKTPARVIRMWEKEFFANIETEFIDFAKSYNERGYSQIIHFHHIYYVSCCAHHLLPFSGEAHVLYIPDKWLIGASKATRLINHFSKCPQLQETLTHDILDCFIRNVKPIGAMIVLQGQHDCMSCRGVTQKDAGVGTSAVAGVFQSEQDMEMKGYELIKLSR